MDISYMSDEEIKMKYRSELSLRLAIFEDWKFLLDLRNDEGTKANSFSQDDLEEESHKNWLHDSLFNPKRKIWILVDYSERKPSANLTPLGMIREDIFENDQDRILLSWAISPTSRGKGYGNKILSLVTRARTQSFYAEIKHENVASIKMTLNNDFMEDKDLEEPSHRVFVKKGPIAVIDEIEKVRTANNVNWMDILRIAFRNSPKETAKVMKKVNEHDSKISTLLDKLGKYE